MGVAHSSCYKLLIPCFVCIKVVAFEFIVYLPAIVGLLEIAVQQNTFVGENFRKLVKKRFSWRKLLQIARWSHHKMPCPQISQRKLANSHKTLKFANVFSLESFPVYSRCSIQARGYKMLVHRIYSIKKPLGP